MHIFFLNVPYAPRSQVRGGCTIVLDHIRILNSHGMPASAVTGADPGTPLPALTEPYISTEQFFAAFDPRVDLLVLTEGRTPEIFVLPGRKVILNQQPAYGFLAIHHCAPLPYNDESVLATIVVSEESRALYQYAFPEARIYRVYNAVDPSLFEFRRVGDKRAKFAMVAKNLAQLKFLLSVLNARVVQGLGPLAEYDFVLLDGLTRAEVARELTQSLGIISLSMVEGHSLLLLEAMLSGTVVLGIRTSFLDEFLTSANSLMVDAGDIRALAHNIETVASGHMTGDARLAEIAATARASALDYSRRRQTDSVLATWRDIVALY